MPTIQNFINVYSHRKPIVKGEWVLRSAYHRLSASQIKSLPYTVCVGIHPGFASESALQQISSLELLIQLPEVLAVGAIGFDDGIPTDLMLQKKVFKIQLELAEKYKKPVIIHKKKDYLDLLPCLRRSRIPWIFHDYIGNMWQTEALLEYNAYFSFGKRLVAGCDETINTIKYIPADRLLLETSNYNINIDHSYKKAASIKQLSMKEFKKLIFFNFESIFLSSRSKF